MKLSPRHAHALFITLMVFAMSLVISLAMTLLNSGPDGFLALRWLRSWGLSAVVAWPTAYLVVPVVRKIVAMVSEP